MYARTAHFHERLSRIGSSSCLPTAGLKNAATVSDKAAEFYSADNWKFRDQLRAIQQEIIIARKETNLHGERVELYELERRIERELHAARLFKPAPTKSFPQMFMDAAEATLNHDVFLKIKDMAAERYAEESRARQAIGLRK